MKKLWLITLIMICSLSTFAQGGWQTSNSIYGLINKRGAFNTTLLIPARSGAPSGIGSLNAYNLGLGALVIDTTNTKMYFFNPKDSTWHEGGGGGSGSGLSAIYNGYGLLKDNDSTLSFDSSILGDLLSGGDTSVFDPVIDSTGQPGQRVLFAGGNNKIRSSPNFLFDSINNKLIINHNNISVGGTGFKLWVQGDSYHNGRLGMAQPPIAPDTSYKPLVFLPGTGVSIFRMNSWPVVNDPSKLSGADTASLYGRGVLSYVKNATDDSTILTLNDGSRYAAKDNSGSGGITALTGDVTASGTGSVAATLATVNSNVGTFGSSTQVPVFTVNGKGLITGVTNTTISGGGGSTATVQAVIAYGDSTYMSGDSYMAGLGPTSVNKSQRPMLQSKYGLLVGNLSQSGSGVFQVMKDLYGGTSPLASNNVFMLMAGLNDVRLGSGSAKTVEKIQGSIRSYIANAFLKTVTIANDAAVTKGGTWVTNSSSSFPSKSIQQYGNSILSTIVSGSTLTYTSTGDNLFASIYGTDGTTIKGGTVTITVDGVLKSTWNSYDKTDGVTDAFTNANTFSNNGIFLTGLGNGSHTVVLTVTSLQASGIIYVDYFGVLDAPTNVKPTIVANIPYLNSAGYAAYGGSNAITSAANTAIESTISEFPTWPAFLADVNTLFDTTTCITGNLHPNDTGAIAIVNAYSNVINPANVLLQIGTINSQTKSANGLVVANGTLVNQTADATNSGIVSAGTQTFGGAKTFNDNITMGGVGKTLSWGTNSLNSLALMLYDNGTTTRYGYGMDGGNMVTLMPTTGTFVFRNGTALTGGTNLFTVAGSTGNIASSGTVSGTVFHAAASVGTVKLYYYPTIYGVGVNGGEVQSFNSNSTRWTWNMGGTLNATGVNEIMRLSGGTAAGTGTLSLGNTAPSASTVLDISSTTRGSLPFPRMTTTQRDAIASPATGLGVYNSTTNTNDFYNGTGWLPMTDQQSRVSTQFDKNNNTFSNITGLSANLAAGKTYKFEAILYTTSDVANGVKFAIGGTATATSIIYEGVVLDANVNAAQTRATALATAVGSVTAVTNAYTKITGTITCNAAGTLTVQFAQNVTNATVSSVLVGSTFEVIQIL